MEGVAILVLVDIPFGGEAIEIDMTGDTQIVAILVLVDIPFGVNALLAAISKIAAVAILVLVDIPFGVLRGRRC